MHQWLIPGIIRFVMMFVGAIGTGVAPPQYFGIVERFSVFAAVGFTAIAGLYLFSDPEHKEKEE